VHGSRHAPPIGQFCSLAAQCRLAADRPLGRSAQETTGARNASGFRFKGVLALKRLNRPAHAGRSPK